MRVQKVETIRGWEWLAEGADILLRRPGELFLMGLACSVASWLLNIVPLIGWLTALLLGPVLFSGLIYAARRSAIGEDPEFADVFVGFGDDGETIGLITLGLVPLGAGIVGGILGYAMSGLGLYALAQLLVFVLACGAWALVVLSVPQITFQHSDAPRSLRLSVDAIVENYGAFGLFAGVVALGTVLLFGLLARIGLSILQPVFGGAVLALVACAAYVAYREVFVEAAGTAGAPQESSHEEETE